MKTYDATILRDLRARLRVRAGRAADQRLCAEIDCLFRFPDLRPAAPDDFGGAFGYAPGDIKAEHGFLMAHNYLGSLDEALQLARAVAPGFRVTLFEQLGGGWSAWLKNDAIERGGDGATAQGALLDAVFAVLLARAPAPAGEGGA